MKDNYWEHLQHNTYDKDCSTCFSENRIMKARKVVNGHNEMLEKHPALKNYDYHLRGLIN